MLTIYIHAFFALIAVPVGLYIFLTKKGTSTHKFVGRFWVAFLLIVSVTAIFIQEITPRAILINTFANPMDHSKFDLFNLEHTQIQRNKTYKA